VQSQSLARRLTAEGLGTGLLLAAILGSGIMGERLSGDTAALALFCNSTATGAFLIVLIGAMGPVSGRISIRLSRSPSCCGVRLSGTLRSPISSCRLPAPCWGLGRCI